MRLRTRIKKLFGIERIFPDIAYSKDKKSAWIRIFDSYHHIAKPKDKIYFDGNLIK